MKHISTRIPDDSFKECIITTLGIELIDGAEKLTKLACGFPVRDPSLYDCSRVYRLGSNMKMSFHVALLSRVLSVPGTGYANEGKLQAFLS